MPEATLWQYGHRYLGEEALPDGQPVLRPMVTVGAPGWAEEYESLVDAGPPFRLQTPNSLANSESTCRSTSLCTWFRWALAECSLE